MGIMLPVNLAPSRVVSVLGLVVALVSLLAVAWGCGDEATPTHPPAVVLSAPEQQDAVPPSHDAAPPPVVPETAAGAPGFSHYVFEDIGGEVATTLVEGPAAEQVRRPVSYQRLKEIHDNGEPLDDLEMSAQEIEELVGQLDEVRQATERYQDVNLALAEGFIQTTLEVPNMGAHFVHPARRLDGRFDPAEPEILMYAADEELGWRLVGTAFVLPRLQVGDEHPKAFAGPLDNWHVHYNLCTGPNIVSFSATPEECARQQGVWVPSYGWMIHAWVWDENPMGVFSMWNPSVPPLVSSDLIRPFRDALAPVEGTTVVAIENFGFAPANIRVGETLTWDQRGRSASHSEGRGGGRWRRLRLRAHRPGPVLLRAL